VVNKRGNIKRCPKVATDRLSGKGEKNNNKKNKLIAMLK